MWCVDPRHYKIIKLAENYRLDQFWEKHKLQLNNCSIFPEYDGFESVSE